MRLAARIGLLIIQVYGIEWRRFWRVGRHGFTAGEDARRHRQRVNARVRALNLNPLLLLRQPQDSAT